MIAGLDTLLTAVGLPQGREPCRIMALIQRGLTTRARNTRAVSSAVSAGLARLVGRFGGFLRDVGDNELAWLEAAFGGRGG